MIWNHTRAYGYDDDMTKKTSGKTEERRFEIPLTHRESKHPLVTIFEAALARWEAAGYTRQDLADRIPCSVTSITKWLDSPPAKVTTKFRKAFKLMKVKMELDEQGNPDWTGKLPPKPDDEPATGLGKLDKIKRLIDNPATSKSLLDFVDYLWDRHTE